MKISVDVIDALKRATVHHDRIELPLKRGEGVLFYKVDRVLKLVGCKWNRTKRAHVFESGDAPGRIAAAVKTGIVSDPQREFDFFETPPKLADRLVELAHIEKYHSVLEPSAGAGALCAALERSGIQSSQISVCELRNHLRDGLKEKGYEVLMDDFLKWKSEMKFDRLILNPPFKDDIGHVEKAFSMLSEGGVLAAIISSGWMSKKTRRHELFRRWFEELKSSGQSRILKIPTRTFLASGSEAEAMILVLTRRS